MTKKNLILILLMIVVMCPGCSKKISSKTDESLQITEDPYKPYIEEKLGIQVDNDTPLKQLLTKEYELSELQDFFGKDASIGGCLPEYTDIKYHSSSEILTSFPIECLRSSGGGTYYTVYKIRDGGYYYIYWNAASTIPINGDITVLFTICVNNPASYKKLRKLVWRDITTVEDILNAAPETVMNFMYSSGPYSYTLLDDWDVMVIRYYVKGDGDITKNTLVVMDYEVVALDSISADCFYVIRKDIYL